MNALMRLELNKALRNRWFVVALAVSCVLACASAVENSVMVCSEWARTDGVSREWAALSSGGSYGQCLLISVSAAREAFFLLLPLLATIPYATSLRTERLDGVLSQMYVRTSRGRYLTAKGLATFATGFLVAAVPLVLNFVVLSCVLPAYTPEALDGLQFGLGSHEAFVNLFFGAPFAYLVVNVMIDGFLCGAWALLLLAVSALVDNRVLLLAGSHIFLLLTQYLNDVVFLAAGVNGFRFNLFALLEGAALAEVRSTPVLLLLLVLTLAIAVGLLRACRDSDVL